MSNFKSEFSKDLVKKFFKPKTEETQNGTCVPDQGATPFNGADDCIAGQQMLQPKPNNDTNIKREGAYKFDELPSLTEVTKAVTDEASKIITSKTLPMPNEDNWRDVLDHLRINPDEEYSEPPGCIGLLDDDQLVWLGTFGNFCAVIGKAKSRKTFLVSLVTAAGLLRNGVLHDKIRVTLPGGGKKSFCLIPSKATTM